MCTIVQTELKKAFSSFSFLFSLLLGAVTCILQSLWFYSHVYRSNLSMLSYVCGLSNEDPKYGEWYATCLLEGWLGCESYSSYKSFFLLVLPLIAVIPYGISLLQEWRSGYVMQMLVRCGRKQYITAKSIAVFFSGGIVIAVPMLVSLIVNLCYLPATGIDMLSMQGQLIDRNMWVNLYYDSPIVYALCYTIVLFLYGGIYAVSSVICTGWLDNRFTIWIFPLMLHCMLSYGVYNLFPEISAYNPAIFLDPGQPVSSNMTFGIVVTTVVILIVEGMLLWLSNRRRDFL